MPCCPDRARHWAGPLLAALVVVPAATAADPAESGRALCQRLEQQARAWLVQQTQQWIKNPENSSWKQVQLSPPVFTPTPCIPPPDDCPHWTFHTTATRPLGHLWITARCLADDKPLSPAAHQWRQRFKVRVGGQLPVLYSRTRLMPGELLATANSFQAATDIDKLQQGFFVRSERTGPLVARQYIQPNSLLTPALLQKPDLVRSGAPVNIRLTRAQLVISATGIATESGKQGDIVKVQRKADGGSATPLIHCRVLGQDLVEPVIH